MPSRSDHFDGEKFFNPWGANNTKTLWDVLKWKLSGSATEWPANASAGTAIPVLVDQGKAASIHITAIGHATTYIQDENISVLTDPQFSERASPVTFAGPRRHQKPAVTIEQLPAVDYVVVSHNHYDHMDLPSLKALYERFHPQFIVPLGNAKFLRDEGIEGITELDWWQSLGPVQLVPAQHWSARGVGDRNLALWGGFVLTMSGRKVYFAGDTGYGPHFKMIKDRVGDIELSLLPIGAYEPRSFMKDQHMNPEDAVKAHLDLNCKKSFAIHFEVFQLTDEGFDEPRKALREELQKANLSADAFFLPKLGETLILK
ncbi:MAG: hypothetical protein RJB66_210 [Pseudomonadota bacterium]|jgi:L-ascorbate metabolism protein UlaG (beta-lactamase superfamily)